MAVLAPRLGFVAAPPYPRTSSGRFRFSPSSCRAVANDAGVGGPARPITVDGDPPTVVSAPGRRIVAIGDVHGDLSQTRAALVLAGVLSAESEGHLWTGGRTVLVQVGDILDRGEDEIAILSLLSSLNMQAKSQGGAVFQVNGNHETINVEGDFRYVDPGGFDECMRFLDYLDECDGNWDNAFLNWVNVSEIRKKEYGALPNGDWRPWDFVKKQKGFAARSSLFKRGGLLACELARHPVVLKINDWIFCHGGLLPHHVEYGIERMNREVSMWMKCSGEDRDDEKDIPFIATRGYDSVVWSRLYSQDPAERTRRALMLSSIVAEQTLEAVGAKGMVVGHTPQMHGVNCKCDGKVWCIDVGMSSGILYSRPEVLEIVNDRPRVLKKRRELYDEMEVLDYLYIIENINCPESYLTRQFLWEYWTQYDTERYIENQKDGFVTKIIASRKPDANMDQKPKAACSAKSDQRFSDAYLYQHSNTDYGLIERCRHQESCK